MTKNPVFQTHLPLLALGTAILLTFGATPVSRAAVTLVAWNTTGLSGITPDPYSATTIVTNMETGTGLNELTRGAGLTATSLSSGFAASGWNGPTDLAGAATANNYFQFAVSPATGFALGLDEIAMNFRTTGTGPMAIQWQYSLDGFATAGTSIGATINRTNAGSGTQVDNYSINLSGIAALQGLEAEVTFRLFGWNSSGSAGTAAFGTSTGDNLALIGTVGPPALGDELYWVGDDQILGGSGTSTGTGGTAWRATNDDGGGGPWNSASRANFGGASPGTVEVAGTVNVAAGMNFTTDGYELTGGVINLVGNDPAGNTITTLGGVTATIGTMLNGSTGMTKAGTGTLVLTGNHTYTGGTFVSVGTLQLGDGVTNGSVLGDITNNATLVFNNGSAQTFSGAISGIGALIKDGAGNLTLSGANTYSGGTTVSGGILTGNTNSLQGNILNNAAVTFDQATDGTYTGDMSGSGILVKSGSGTVSLTGNSSHTGGTSVTGGTLVAGSNTALGAGPVEVTGANLLAGAGITVNNQITVNEVLAGNQLVAYWNFNNYDGGAGPIAATSGTGTISLADWTGTTANFNGSTLNALFGDPSGASLSLVGDAGNGSFIGISGLDLSGLTDAQVTFATRGTGTGFDQGQWSFSTDGINFTNFGGNTATQSTTFGLADTGPTSGLDNTATGLLRYTLAGATSTSGNNRIDNLQINAFRPYAAPVLGTNATSGTATFTGDVTLLSDVQLTAATGGTAVFEGVLHDGGNGASGVTKTGGGTVILSGDNTYTGTTLVSGGTLIINGDQSGATGAVIVAAGGSLAGSGIIGGHTTISGTHSPGASPGVQTFLDGLTYDGANVVWELIANSTSGRGTNFDGINVFGNLDFSEPTPLDLVFNLPGSAVDFSDPFWTNDYFTTDGWLLYEVTNGAISNFDQLFINSISWIDGFGNSSNDFFRGKEFGLFLDDNRIFLTYTPEPSKAVLLAIALITMLMRRRRR